MYFTDGECREQVSRVVLWPGNLEIDGVSFTPEVLQHVLGEHAKFTNTPVFKLLQEPESPCG